MNKPDLKIDGTYIRRLIKSLNYYSFSAGSKRYERQYLAGKKLETDFFVGISEEQLRDFLRCTNWSFKKAQALIIKTRLLLEQHDDAKSLAFEAPYNYSYVIALLTDYADALGWILLSHDISEVRNQFLGIKDYSKLKNHNWESVERALKQFNKDPDQIALANDLTSFMQIGDVFCFNTATKQISRIELKEGKVNEAIGKILYSADGDFESFKRKTEAFVQASDNPRQALSQLKRNIRQQLRTMNSAAYHRSKGTKRIDIKTEKEVTIFEENRDEESWANGVIDAIKQGGLVSGWYDRCLFFLYGKHRLNNMYDGFFRFRICEHFGLGLTPEESLELPIFNVGQQLANPTLKPQSLNLMVLGEKNQKELLAANHFLLAYLHFPALKSFLEEDGYTIYLKKVNAAEQMYSDKLMRKMFGANKIPVIEKVDNPRAKLSILTGTWSRILFGFMAPQELINYSSTTLARFDNPEVSSKKT